MQKEKIWFFSLVMRAFRIYSLSNFQTYHTAMLATVITLYITAAVLMDNWKFVSLTTFVRFPSYAFPNIIMTK